MPLRVGIGFSSNLDPLTAAQEAATQAKIQLDQDRIDVALLFNTAQYDPKEFLPALHASLNQTKIIGCSTSGMALSDRVESAGIAVLLLTSENIKFETGRVSHLALQDPQAAGKNFVNDCISGFGQLSRKLLLFFSDGLLDSTTAFSDGIKAELGPAIPIIGAGSSDSGQFKKTYQFYNDQILNSGACGLLWGGKFRLGISCQHGWKPLGKPRTITTAKDNIIKSIDGKKAIALYEQFFPDAAQILNRHRLDRMNLRYPLGVRKGSGQNFMIRNVVAALDDGSIVCQDKVTAGDEVHLMLGNKRSCLQATEQAAYQVREQLAGISPKIILLIDSSMRRLLLGRGAVQEIQMIKKILGENVPLLGIYSQKEIFTSSGAEQTAQAEVHNSSLVILAIG